VIAPALEQRTWEALERVFDPCSVATRSPLSIVDMGLVREVSVDEGANVAVSICPTSPSCMLMASICEGAETEVAKVDGVGAVTVTIDAEFFWTPEAMSENGVELLERHREERAAHAPTPLGRRREPVGG
jgi:metal-sulfur cluster biosynthetic enzyme